MSIRTRYVPVTATILLLLGSSLSPIRAEDATVRRGIEFTGSMYADLGLVHYVLEDSRDRADFSGTSVLAIQFRNSNRTNAKIEGDMELLLPYGAAADTYLQTLRSRNDDSISRAVDDAALRYFQLFSVGTAPVIFDMRKLYLEFYLPFADIALGRQIVNFGQGTVFSPIDAFSMVQISDLNLRRGGSDVAKIRIPFGTLSGMDCIVEAPFADSEHSSAIKAFTTLAGWDVSLVGLYRHKSEEVVVGTAFKGDAVVGIHGEVVEHFVDGTDDQYTEVMIGTDYSVKNIWFFDAEYYYRDRQSGSDSPWGRHNAYVSVRYMPTDLMQFALTGLYQFENQNAIGTFSWYYNLLQNVDFTAYVRGFYNRDLPAAPDLQYSTRMEVKF